MHKINFKYAKAKNFLCFGEEGIEIDFTSYGNIVCIKGKNLDVDETDGKCASNGSGKSSIPEIIVYALYGKTIKKPKKLTHLDLINNKDGKKLYVELLWNEYRVVRTRDANNKGTLRIWKSDKGEWTKDAEITRGVKKPQEMLDKEIKYTYEAFINVFVFSDDNTVPFLECDTPNKRQIVENLLSLDKYRGYFDNASKATKTLKSSVKELTKEYEFLCNQKDNLTSSVAQIEKQEQGWYDSKTKELDTLLADIKKKRDELENSNTGSALAAYQEAQEQIAALKEKVPGLEEKKNNVVELITQATKKGEEFEEKVTAWKKSLAAAKDKYEAVEKLIKENKKIVSDIEGKTGKNCPYCRSVVSEKNFADILEQANAVLKRETPDYETLKTTYEDALKNYNAAVEVKQTVDKALNNFKTRLNAANLEISEIHCSISKLSRIEKPDSSVAELLLSEQLESLKLQVTKKQEELKGATPFEKIKESAVTNLAQKVKECSAKDEEIKKLEAKIPYYEFWVKAFGDNGIRKYVIDGIIPILNSQIEYWLQFLIDNKIKLVFDNTLDVTIDRYPFNGRAYVYHGMSGGQRRRLNLTVAAAWELVSALNSGASLSAIFLDEVTMNMDEIGVLGIYRMICELAKEKQVFVIDHNESLLQMLGGCDVINIEMQNEITHKVT